MMDEQNRLDNVYRGRQSLAGRYVRDNAGNRYNTDFLKRRIQYNLEKLYNRPEKIKMLDLGSGELFWTRQFIDLGIASSNCIATDILDWRLKAGRKEYDEIQAVTASAFELPFQDGTFDLISQLTMMTSVLDQNLRRRIAADMIRVLKPGGYLLWYDFRYNNPGNPHTRAIGISELKELYAPLPLYSESLTLLPPLARKIGGGGDQILNLLHRLRILRSHLLAIIGPKG